MRDRAARGIALGVAVVAVACGFSEQKVVDQYFNALNAQDNQTLSSFAAVKLDTKGKRIDKWKISAEAPETRVPNPLTDLVKKQKDAEAAVAANKKEASSYSLDHLSEVDQVRELMKKGATIPAKLQPTADVWRKFGEQDRERKKAEGEAKEAVEREKHNVSLSVGTQDGLESLTGEMVEKPLDVELTTAGEAKAYTMTLRKYELTPAKGGKLMSRWIIYALQPK